MMWQEKPSTSQISCALLGGLLVVRIWQRNDARWMLAVNGNRRSSIFHRMAFATLDEAKAAVPQFVSDLGTKLSMFGVNRNEEHA